MKRPLLVLFIISVAACASLPPGTLPQDMSAEAHEREALRLQREAASHQARYDPNARSVYGPGSTSDSFSVPYTDNPTRKYSNEAKRLREHAAAHRAAARELLRNEDEACTTIGKDARETCPLIDKITDVNAVDGGVRLRLASNTDTAEMVRHIRCHLALAATRGFEGMASCPLYLKGVTVEQRSDLHCVDLLVDDPKLRIEIEASAGRMVSAVHQEAHRQAR